MRKHSNNYTQTYQVQNFLSCSIQMCLGGIFSLLVLSTCFWCHVLPKPARTLPPGSRTFHFCGCHAEERRSVWPFSDTTWSRLIREGLVYGLGVGLGVVALAALYPTCKLGTTTRVNLTMAKICFLSPSTGVTVTGSEQSPS